MTNSFRYWPKVLGARHLTGSMAKKLLGFEVEEFN